MISNVSVGLESSTLVVGVVGAEPGSRFCFYVYVNERRVFDSGYIKDSYASFDLSGLSGIVRVKSFVKVKGEVTSKFSKPLFLSSGTYDLNSEKTIPGSGIYLSEGFEYPVAYFPGKESRLFVMLTAAVNRSQYDLPAFNRWTWAGKGVFPGHVVCISDPTISVKEDFGLGWYFGGAEKDATEGLAKLVMCFAEKLGVASENIIVWGSSGGGFASLSLAARLEGATAVVVNPQTKILDYQPSRFVDSFLVNCIGEMSNVRSDLDEKLMRRLDVGRVWRDLGKSRVLYFQNMSDTHHFEKHFKPFCRDVGFEGVDKWSPCGRFYFVLYNDSRGHASESIDMARSAIELVLQ